LLGDLPIKQTLELNQTGGLASAILFGDDVVGVVTIMPSGEFMIAVDPAYHRRGIASRAAVQAVDFVFSSAKRHISRIWATTIPGRLGSQLANKLNVPVEDVDDKQITWAITRDAWQQRRGSGA
jgi:hypothetical protein